MTEHRIDPEALRRLADAATEGPWEADHSEEDNSSIRQAGREWWDGLAFAGRQPDAEFIAAARTAVPQLLDQLDQTEAERDAARGYISELETAVQSRNDVIKHRDARIKAVRDVLDQAEAAINRHPAYTFGGQRMAPIVNGADIRRALDGDA